MGSKPTQPAPGRKTSVHACRSVKSLEAPAGPFQRLQVRGELDQIAGNETGGKAQVAQDLHQQPGRIAAGAGAQGKRLLTALYPLLQADDIVDLALYPLIEADQEIQRGGADSRYLSQEMSQPGTGHLRFKKGAQFPGQGAFVGEWDLLRVRLQKEIEGIEDCHFGNQIDLD